jgi:predicted nuclease with TOPRIM domain
MKDNKKLITTRIGELYVENIDLERKMANHELDFDVDRKAYGDAIIRSAEIKRQLRRLYELEKEVSWIKMRLDDTENSIWQIVRKIDDTHDEEYDELDKRLKEYEIEKEKLYEKYEKLRYIH